MEDGKIIALLEGYSAGSLSEAEEILLFRWYNNAGLEEFHRVLAQCDRLTEDAAPFQEMPVEFRTRLEEAIRDHEATQLPPAVPLYKRFRLGWAAAVLLVLGATYLVVKNRQTLPAGANNTQVADVAPGTTKAVLILADGSKINLDSAGNGQLATQGVISIQRNQGAVSYSGTEDAQKAASKEMLFNTLATGRGEQSPPLTLSDGTKVWLNALSSIRFPVVFSDTARTVEITGEAYFEIARQPSKPFHVKAHGMTVDVLGTEFNVNAYSDEPEMKTTLVAGKVRVSANAPDAYPAARKSDLTLEPGQQARITGLSCNLVKNPDMDQAVAWKRGLFDFSHADLQTVLRQLARWYDIDVKFEGIPPVRTFNGKITRDLSLAQVIHLLQDLDVRFRIEDRTLIVTK